MMTFPTFYQAERVGELYAPDLLTVTQAGVAAGLRPANADTRKVYLLLVDAQVDFIHPQGALSVPGAVADTRRTIEWIYAHAGELTAVGASLDSHLPIQIFSPTWWVDMAGNHPSPYTTITAQQVAAGKWRALYEPEWSASYVEQLEENAKKILMIWPYHTLIGTPGHNLMPALYEAMAYHSAARQAQPRFLTKGTIPKSEFYSIMEPEVKVSDHPLGGVNTAFMDELAGYDLIYVAGQAKSHCVLETVSSMMRYYPPEIVAKLRVLEDGMSSVAHPEIDFEGLANEAFGRFAESGLTLVKTDAGLG